MASKNDRQKPIVLVVEDEPLLRLYATELVEGAGYAVVQAGNADDAIAILAARTDIRIVFTDIDMPGSMNGLRLAAAIRDRWPPIELILTSGLMTVSEKDMPARGKFFAKPYDPDAIVRTLNEFSPLH